MVSPEVLRRYEFFGGLAPDQLNAIAMLTEEVVFDADATVFESDQPARHMFVMVDGCVELHYVAVDEIHKDLRKELFVSEVNPGEVFGISALLEPFVYQGTVRARSPSRVLRVDAAGLRALSEVEPEIAATLMRQMAQAALMRLHDTRILLAAERA